MEMDVTEIQFILGLAVAVATPIIAIMKMDSRNALRYQSIVDKLERHMELETQAYKLSAVLYANLEGRITVLEVDDKDMKNSIIIIKSKLNL